jgi:hypothetical protein
MKRVISFFTLSQCLIVLVLLLSLTGCNKETNQTQNTEANQSKQGSQSSESNQVNRASQSNQSTQTNQADINTFSNSPKPTGMTHLILYFPDNNYKYLVAQERYINIEKSIEDTILRELLKKFSSTKNIRILGIAQNAGVLTVNLSSDFAEAMKAYGNKKNIMLYSLVNSLTELNWVKEVKLLVEGREISEEPSNSTPINYSNAKLKTLKRNRAYFNRDSKLLPSQVLQKEMTYEQNGQWLKAYELMSDDQNNIHRKYYNEYYKEMEETKENGFLSTKFNVNGYKLNKTGDKASVEVQFINSFNSSYAQVVDKAYFNVVKIGGVWMVDWLTSQ